MNTDDDENDSDNATSASAVDWMQLKQLPGWIKKKHRQTSTHRGTNISKFKRACSYTLITLRDSLADNRHNGNRNELRQICCCGWILFCQLICLWMVSPAAGVLDLDYCYYFLYGFHYSLMHCILLQRVWGYVVGDQLVSSAVDTLATDFPVHIYGRANSIN